MTHLEDRVNPTPVVNITAIGDLAENSGSAIFRISRSTTSGTLNVGATITGTASNGLDYYYTPMIAYFQDGVGTMDLTVTGNNDSHVEGTETIIYTIPTDSSYTIGTGTATINLYDDDTAQVSVAKQGSDPTEGGNGTFRITRSGSTSGNLTVNFATGGTATSGTDYTSIGTSATITSGNSYVDVTVTTLADNLVEGDESASIQLTDGGSTYSAYGSSAFAALAIDDDVATTGAVVSLVSGSVIFDGGAGVASSLTVSRGSGSVTIADTGPSAIYIDAASSTGFAVSGSSVTFTGSFTGVNIQGNDGNDSLNGSSFSSSATLTLDGGTGNDTITGSAGDDSLLGGDGADWMLDGDGDDIVYGGDGADEIEVGSGEDEVNAGDGDDNIDVTASGPDNVDAGPGNDQIVTQAVLGGAFYGGEGADRIDGTLAVGDITIHGGSGSDTVYGGAGEDYILGENDSDLIYGMANDDNIFGGHGADTIFGGLNSSQLEGERYAAML